MLVCPLALLKEEQHDKLTFYRFNIPSQDCVLYIWIKGAINLSRQNVAGRCLSTLLTEILRGNRAEYSMMNHRICGAAQIRTNLHFHVIIRHSCRFQITFRAALILLP